MKISNHLPHAFHAAGHRAHHILLVPVVDSHVWIGGPDEHGVDAAVALFQVVEITVNGVFSGDWIVEVAVMHHHLRLNEA